jgi:hypothetical protein
MTKHFFHNTLRKLFNVEWSQLSFLTESQKDNFFADPPRFFIATDDETSDKIWALLFPNGPVAGGQVVRGPAQWWSREVKVGGVPVSDGLVWPVKPNDARKAAGLPPLPPRAAEAA